MLFKMNKVNTPIYTAYGIHTHTETKLRLKGEPLILCSHLTFSPASISTDTSLRTASSSSAYLTQMFWMEIAPSDGQLEGGSIPIAMSIRSYLHHKHSTLILYNVCSKSNMLFYSEKSPSRESYILPKVQNCNLKISLNTWIIGVSSTCSVNSFSGLGTLQAIYDHHISCQFGPSTSTWGKVTMVWWFNFECSFEATIEEVFAVCCWCHWSLLVRRTYGQIVSILHLVLDVFLTLVWFWSERRVVFDSFNGIHLHLSFCHEPY